MAQPRVGPIVMPWDSQHPEEVAVFVVTGLLGAIVAATLVHHYRRHRRGRPLFG